VSAISNITEGFGRGGNKEFSQFFSHTRGSIAEVQTQRYVALDAGYLDKEAFDRIYTLADHPANLISGFMRYLTKSHFRGAQFKYSFFLPQP
jgi:four helix bundle protein